MKFKVNPLIILSLVLLVVLMVIFADTIVTFIVLLPFLNPQINGLVFTDDYDPDTTDGAEVLNCLHGGACPTGVYFEPTGSESTGEDGTPIATPDSEVDAGDGGIVASPLPDPNADFDNDGIVDSLDECILDPETVNGFLDFDGCPETSTIDPETNEEIIVDELPDIDIFRVIINPPELTSDILNTATQSPSAYIESNATVNLNTIVDNAIIVFIIMIVGIVIFIAILIRGKI